MPYKKLVVFLKNLYLINCRFQRWRSSAWAVSWYFGEKHKALGPIVKRLTDALAELKILLDIPPVQQAESIASFRKAKTKITKYSETYQRKYSECLTLANGNDEETKKVASDFQNHMELIANTDDGLFLLTTYEVERRGQKLKSTKNWGSKTALGSTSSSTDRATSCHRGSSCTACNDCEASKIGAPAIRWNDP